jgi:hypothetical protein
VSDAAATAAVCSMLSGYLNTELATRVAAAGLPTQTVVAVADGAHIADHFAGLVSVVAEDSETVLQYICNQEDRTVPILVEAQVSCLDLAIIDRVRSVWADSIRAVIEQRWRVASPANFYALLREQTLGASSSTRRKAGVRGVLGALGLLRQPPALDPIQVRFVFGQRVSSKVDVK